MFRIPAGGGNDRMMQDVMNWLFSCAQLWMGIGEVKSIDAESSTQRWQSRVSKSDDATGRPVSYS